MALIESDCYRLRITDSGQSADFGGEADGADIELLSHSEQL